MVEINVIITNPFLLSSDINKHLYVGVVYNDILLLLLPYIILFTNADLYGIKKKHHAKICYRCLLIV